MLRTKLILLACFVVTFAAGTTAGLVMTKSQPPQHEPWLHELNLSDAQREQMRKIWSGAMDPSRRDDQRRALSEERDKAIAAMLTPEQLTTYKQIQADYSRKSEELAAQRKVAFDQAVERTKKEVLTPEQAAQYDEILKRQRGPSGSRGPWGGPPHSRRGGSRPASAPASGPAAPPAAVESIQ
jgi:Spy/CpxP family protein refolding chaperone